MESTDSSLKLIIRDLEPFSILSERDLDALTAHAAVIEFPPGGEVYVEGDDDGFANFVLEGEADRYIDRKRLAASAARGNVPIPIDNPGPKQHTLVARTRLKVLRLLRPDLDRALAASAAGANEDALCVSEIERDESDDWMTRFLRSALFKKLSAGTIEAIFSRMVEVGKRAGAEVVRQGERSDYFYVIESGRCEVVRRPSHGRSEVRLAVLGPGGAFGEEAIVGDEPRDATVRMLSDGKLMRLDEEDFRNLLVKPLVQGVTHRQACWMVEQGARWIDTRSRPGGRTRTVEGATSIPHEVLRIACRNLDPDLAYIVRNDNIRTSRLGAFLMAQAGHDVYYLDEIMNEIPEQSTTGSNEPSRTTTTEDAGHAAPVGEPAVAGESPPESAPAWQVSTAGDLAGLGDIPDDIRALLDAPPPPLPRDEYADTMVGIELANLIDELDERHQRFGAVGDTEPGELAVAADPSNPLTGPPAANSVVSDAVADDPGAAPATPPAPTEPALGAAEDELRRILSAAGMRICEYVHKVVSAHRTRLERQLAERITEVRRNAGLVLAERTREMREKYETAYVEKERVLRRDYERLMALASKMSHQKAEIQRKRKELELKLRDADTLYREVAQIGGSLIDEIGEFEEFEPTEAFTEQRH